ncbi:hypothetical protein Dole_2572 [Desulfosudis oleivorans Hxd3]|uniref:Uncharacterized protein n=1 Tax=Desulfosudis oleivorans (strain DSM 6200 / JCM 39069 / Hxd3) TaxID=96561 RepID=A8ZWP4_DESOH|nr:hypothetical protein Dole_2572 [Desulfosudis oleivorans Hxd3]
MYFSWRQEKYQKKAALQLGLRLPSRKHFFRRGQELARFAVLKQPARFSRKKHSRSAALQWAKAIAHAQYTTSALRIKFSGYKQHKMALWLCKTFKVKARKSRRMKLYWRYAE